MGLLFPKRTAGIVLSPQVHGGPLSEPVMRIERGTSSFPSSVWLDFVPHPAYPGNALNAGMQWGVLAKPPFSTDALPLCLLTFSKHTQYSLMRIVSLVH